MVVRVQEYGNKFLFLIHLDTLCQRQCQGLR